MFAQTIVDAPKYGASRRAAAISAPRMLSPTTKTIEPERRLAEALHARPGAGAARERRPCGHHDVDPMARGMIVYAPTAARRGSGRARACGRSAARSARRRAALVAAPSRRAGGSRLAPGRRRAALAGGLSVRTAGDGDRVVILLHGLAASGDYFGAGYDELAEDARLVICDLRGFGARWTRGPAPSTRCAPISPPWTARARAALDGRAAHASRATRSARCWRCTGRRGRADVERVVCFSARCIATARGRRADRARWAASIGCSATQGRRGAGAVLDGCAVSPGRAVGRGRAGAALPVAITRMAVRHTWASYTRRDERRHRQRRLGGAARRARGGGRPGAAGRWCRDPLPVPGRAARACAPPANVTTAAAPGAGHQLPITHPAWCADRSTDPLPLPR